MNPLACGLDFGTSNSTLGIMRGGQPVLVSLEGSHNTLPSAVFFSFDDDGVYFGRHAVNEYVEGADGRLMRALKSVLGSSLMHDTTQIKRRAMPFTEVLGTFIGHMKTMAETETGTPLENVVLGRPVHFVDEDAAADADARNQLETTARAQGFKNILFQFEPIAAALDYERTVKREQLALIIDIGGGTSDFSIVRVGPERMKAADRKPDILANTGVHIGGTDIDKLLGMAHVMPHLGYQSPMLDGRLNVPSSPYFDLTTWQRINQLYKKTVLLDLVQVAREAKHPELVERLMAVIETRQGHALAGRVEHAKISLTEHSEADIRLKLPKETLHVSVTRSGMEQAIGEAAERIATTVQHTIKLAGIRHGDIQALFLTGGSTQIPLVKNSILSLFPEVNVVQGDTFGSVGLGLTLDAARKFA